MVKTRSSAKVGRAAQNSSAENGNPSELRSRLKTTENGHRSQKTYNTSRQVSDPLAFASQAVRMYIFPSKDCGLCLSVVIVPKYMRRSVIVRACGFASGVGSLALQRTY